MKALLLLITILQVTNILITIVYLVIGALLLILLFRLLAKLYRFFIHGLLAFIIGHRAYFYKYISGEVFYSERFKRILIFFRLGRNKKWAIHKSLAGYVKKPFWRQPAGEKTVNIFSKAHGNRHPVAYARFIHDTVSNIKKADLFMFIHTPDGDKIPINDKPVGYVDENGNIFKYYLNFNDWTKDNKLEKPIKAGCCCNLSFKEKRKFNTADKISDDSEALKFIEKTDYDLAAQRDDESGEISESLRDSWYSLRLNYPAKQKVKAVHFDATSRKGKRRWFELWIWRFMNVVPLNWNVKARAFGYGCCRENYNWGKSTNLETSVHSRNDEQKGIPLLYIACAALLLLEEQGFLKYEEGDEKEEKAGWAETALISLIPFLILYKFLLPLSKWIFLFPFIGEELSSFLLMMLFFIGLWGLVRFIYHKVLDRPAYLKQMIGMLNANIGVSHIGHTIIILGAAGLIFTVFVLPYTLAAFFLSIIIAVLMNRIHFPSIKWPVINPYGENEGAGFSDENGEGGVVKQYQWEYNTSFRNISANFDLHFNEQTIINIRKLNPFQKDISEYTATVGEMINDELFLKLDEKAGEVIRPGLKTIESYFNQLAAQYKLSGLEKLNMILSFVQQAIAYKVDTESEPLLKSGIQKEYCRYSRETLFDMEGDCDCKSELAAVLFAQSGYSTAYFVTDDHAFIGLCSAELYELEPYFKNTFFEYKGNKYLLCETTAHGMIVGHIPSGITPDIVTGHVIIKG